MVSIYVANPNRQVENSLEPDYKACDVCGFGIEKIGEKNKCPNCETSFFLNDPMKYDVKNQRGPKIKTLIRR